jgi:hypothetical protein
MVGLTSEGVCELHDSPLYALPNDFGSRDHKYEW